MGQIDQIAKEISVIVPKLIRSMRTGLPATANVTPAQLVMLLAISEKGVCRATDLTKEIKVSAPTITGLIDRLMREKYLVRIPDVNDRRAINIKLTPKGENLVNEFLSHIKSRWKSILIHLKPEERLSFLNSLKRIITVLTTENKKALHTKDTNI